MKIHHLAVISVVEQTVWRQAKPVVVRDVVLLPAVGFLGIILLWWFVATFLTDLMPNPAQALVANLDYILHPF